MRPAFKDFEDALQNFSGEQKNEINVIITRNIKDYKGSKLAVVTPDNYLKWGLPALNN